jgi:hypothetical protein
MQIGCQLMRIDSILRVGYRRAREEPSEIDIEIAKAQRELLEIRERLAELKFAHDRRLALRKLHGKFPYGKRKKSGSYWRDGWR